MICATCRYSDDSVDIYYDPEFVKVFGSKSETFKVVEGLSIFCGDFAEPQGVIAYMCPKCGTVRIDLKWLENNR